MTEKVSIAIKFCITTEFTVSLMMTDGRDSKSSATLKSILDDLLSKNTDEEIKIILSQQDNAEETVFFILFFFREESVATTRV